MEEPFHYTPQCSAPGCDRPATLKLGAPWSNGRSHELKNYGLACDQHRDGLLADARRRRQGLALAEGETVGDVGVYRLDPLQRDSLLTRLPEEPDGLEPDPGPS